MHILHYAHMIRVPYRHSMISTFLIYLIRLYQIIVSPMLGTNCRFHPTCSAYALQAIKDFGAMRGLFYGIRRLIKCHPFGSAGYDPVPSSSREDVGDVAIQTLRAPTAQIVTTGLLRSARNDGVNGYAITKCSTPHNNTTPNN